MKLTHVSCEQFAGVRDLDISLEDGINVIYGKNESGKSTFVNLISRTLFQDVKEDKRSKEGRDFKKSFFTAPKRGNTAKTDSIDGEIKFETEQGTYTLAKEWGDSSRCTLKTPDDMFRDSESIKKILKDILVYGEGVYADMLLSSQRNADKSLETILQDQSKSDATKREIADAVSQAFIESAGVSVDAVGQKIQEKMDEIGKNWDFERGGPVPKKKGTNERREKEVGSILQAYYRLEDAKNVLSEISDLEDKAAQAEADYEKKDKALQKAKEKLEEFQKYERLLIDRKDSGKEIERLEGDIKKAKEALSQWPVLCSNMEKAEALKKELEDRQYYDDYSAAKDLHDEITEKEKERSSIPCPEEQEISDVDKAEECMKVLAGKLGGMNLYASVRMSGGNCVEVHSIQTGEEIPVSDTIAITEAVRITVPGVMEMELAPANVDVAAVKEEMKEKQDVIDGIFAKYKVKSKKELENLRDVSGNIRKEILNAQSDWDKQFEGRTFEEIEEEANKISPMPREKEEIEADIRAVIADYDSKTLEEFIGYAKKGLGTYEGDYGSVPELEEKKSNLQEELDKAKEKRSSAQNIPEEFNSITDPKAYCQGLKDEYDEARKSREDARDNKRDTIRDRDDRNGILTSDPSDDVEKAEQEFNEQRALFEHWKHIKEVFEKEKEKIRNNPLVDLAENFARCLAMITNGRVVSEFPEADKLNMKLYSADRQVDYDHLSEGTKETVSLAFRMAVLDHLFPEGGGVTVLDDPFANMDAERTAQAVELVKDCAKRHQVIFLTCKEDYRSMFNGNYIDLDTRKI